MKADIYHELEMLSALTASNDAHIRCAQRSPLFGRGEASKPEPCLVAIVFQYAFVDLAVSETCCLAAGASITDDYFVDRAEKLGLKVWHFNSIGKKLLCLSRAFADSKHKHAGGRCGRLDTRGFVWSPKLLAR